ncbi:protein BET1 [Choanephora cucurbitarum]|uniref:Protein BET1 n=1 Tax=Choanephora cucurbitarum TaxID=101091 RepID=A0A1C7NLJ9_9FUNG|nr:protein BET1 [Choanephora cucurbitarum]
MSTSNAKNNGYIFEQQNDIRLNELSSKLSAIKNITIDIHQDVSDQDRLLDESHNQFSGLGNSLQNSFGRMNRMISKRHQRQLCFYVSIALCVFFVLYYGVPLISYLFGSAESDPTADDILTTPHVGDM